MFSIFQGTSDWLTLTGLRALWSAHIHCICPPQVAHQQTNPTLGWSFFMHTCILSILCSDSIMQSKQTWQIAAQTGATSTFAGSKGGAAPPFLRGGMVRIGAGQSIKQHLCYCAGVCSSEFAVSIIPFGIFMSRPIYCWYHKTFNFYKTDSTFRLWCRMEGTLLDIFWMTAIFMHSVTFLLEKKSFESVHFSLLMRGPRQKKLEQLWNVQSRTLSSHAAKWLYGTLLQKWQQDSVLQGSRLMCLSVKPETFFFVKEIQFLNNHWDLNTCIIQAIWTNSLGVSWPT